MPLATKWRVATIGAFALLMLIASSAIKDADQQRVRADTAEARLVRSERSKAISAQDSVITCGDSVAALVQAARAELLTAPAGDLAVSVRRRGLDTWTKYCRR